MKPHDSNGKVVWVIGASSGIGRCLVAQLLQCGARLIVTSRSAKSYQSYQNHPRVRIIELDLSRSFNAESVCSTAVAQYGMVNSVIYCAGVSQRSPDTVLQYDVAKRLLDINFMALVQLCTAIVPYFINTKQGQIVGIGSLAGSVASPGRSMYSVAKSALRSYLETLHIELKPYHISVQHYHIGFVKTDISRSALTGDGTSYNKMDARQAGGMDAGKCAKKIIRAMDRRNRFNTSIALQLAGRIALVLKVLCPRVLYAQLRKAIPSSRQ